MRQYSSQIISNYIPVTVQYMLVEKEGKVYLLRLTISTPNGSNNDMSGLRSVTIDNGGFHFLHDKASRKQQCLKLKKSNNKKLSHKKKRYCIEN